MCRFTILSSLSMCIIAACQPADFPSSENSGERQIPSTQTAMRQAARAHVATPNGLGFPAHVVGPDSIQYHGGPVIHHPRLVVVYWGPSPVYVGGPSAPSTGLGSTDNSGLGRFFKYVGGTAYWNVTGNYASSGNLSLPYDQFWATADPMTLGQGNTIAQGTIEAELTMGFNTGKLTFDASTIYLVMTPPGVALDLPGVDPEALCGYHDFFPRNGQTVKYAVIRHGGHTCLPPSFGSPNNDVPADRAVTVIAHELTEAVSDPELSAWFNSQSGLENADICQDLFGTTYQTPNGATANVKIAGRDYAVQSVLDVSGHCRIGMAQSFVLTPSSGTATLGVPGANDVVNVNVGCGIWSPTACAVSWSSSNPSVATVPVSTYFVQSINVTPVGLGTANIIGCITREDDQIGAGACVSHVTNVVATFPVAIQGKSVIRPGLQCSWHAVPSGGTPPYSYLWYVTAGSATGSPDAGDPSTWIGQSTGTFDLNVQVTASNGARALATKHVTISPAAPLCTF